MGGAAATDYTVYTKKDLTLRRGEKAIVTLFTRKIQYSHIYRWSPPGAMEHSLVLHNQTDTAWTTGPCLALSAERPLSEDLLKYTPKGGRGELPVTAAINIAHEKSEREIDRKLKAYSPDNNSTSISTWSRWKASCNSATTKSGRRDRHRQSDCRQAARRPSDGGTISVDPTKLQLLERSGSVAGR